MVEFVGFSQGHESTVAAEHWLHGFVSLLGDAAGLVACTHFVTVPFAHVAISFAVPSGVGSADAAGAHREQVTATLAQRLRALLPPVAPEFTGAAQAAVTAHVGRRSGRAVCYPGVQRLTGTLTVAELLAGSAIEEVVVLGGAGAEPQTPVLTRDFVRPQWRDGRLTLVATPAGAGSIAPFEIPDPSPCC